MPNQDINIIKNNYYKKKVSGKLEKQKNYNQYFSKEEREQKSIQSLRHNLNQFIYFQRLYPLLMKIFMQKSLTKKDLELEQYEMTILKLLLYKKKFIKQTHSEITLKLLETIKLKTVKKKSEDQVKFVVKKCINYLQKQFLFDVKNKMIWHDKFKNIPIKKIKENLQTYFFEYHFGDISKRKNIPLEEFFYYRSSAQKNPQNVSSNISNKVITKWKLNPDFIQKLFDCIKSIFFDEFKKFNSEKINMMVFKWDELIDEHGLEKGLKILKKKLNSRGLKLPWTLKEVKDAMDITSSFLA